MNTAFEPGQTAAGQDAFVSNYALELRKIDKRFGQVHANVAIDLKVPAGTIHGIIGENGAGKSTLMSIIYGFYQADSGEIFINGQPANIKNSQDAIAAGIGMVHQHFMLVDNFTVLENVMLGAEGGAMLNQTMGDARKQLEQLTREYNLQVDLDAEVGTLAVGLQQRVEILKALYRGAKILILDEPTGVLTPQETEHLFRILDSLREQGVTVLLITHKLREILAATDNVSVMRRGAMVADRETKHTNREELAELMVGRKVRLKVDKQAANPDKPKLQAENLQVIDERGVEVLKKVSLSVRGGEIVGIAGVSGNGQSELLQVLSGILKPTSGRFAIGEQWFSADNPTDPAELRKHKLGHVPEDRHAMGLVKSFDAYESFMLGFHRNSEYTGNVVLSKLAALRECNAKMEEWDVRPRDPFLRSANFSGGNQQKLVIAREMEQDPDVLLVGQPTRGVDIGAIEFIHKRIIEMRDAGKAVLLVSVELDEIMAIADRILVMFDGAVVGEIAAKDANERILGMMMANAHGEQEQPAEPQQQPEPIKQTEGAV